MKSHHQTNRITRKQCNTRDTVGRRTHAQAQRETLPVKPKIRVIKKVSLGDVSEIKLKRTDTTLDLSQKAKRAEEEKEEEKEKGKGGRR
ncbi:hypothetical protein HDV62DRAFT_364411 [Trichoderma sp. SZMC 28011]